MKKPLLRLMYRHLDSAKIVATVESLQRRITGRFPASSLARMAADLHNMANESAARAKWISQPFWPARALTCTGLAAMLVFIITVIFGIAKPGQLTEMPKELSQVIQFLDSALQDIAMIGAAVFFLATYEARIKRNRALRILHEFRAMAHIIDMHQLTKDPESLLNPANRAEPSPQRAMMAFELVRYLDYCSEMLSLISKMAALYVQNFNDQVVLSAVDEIEDLTNGLSRKIWQKITILDRLKYATPNLGNPAMPSDE